MEELSYTEIMQMNNARGYNEQAPLSEVVVMSNITVNPIKELLELKCKLLEGNINLTFGDYDNLVQDSFKYKTSKLVVIFWEAVNLLDGLQYRIEHIDDQLLNELIDKTKKEILMVFQNLSNVSKVLMNKFTAKPFNYMKVAQDKLDLLCLELNTFLEEKAPANVSLIDTEKIFVHLGVRECIDYRYYLSSKSLYTIPFYKSYIKLIEPFLRALFGRTKKLLVLDCDNTLWKGIIGEDGKDGLKISENKGVGMIYWEVQNLIKSLTQEGVLISLNSKNNEQDVEITFSDEDFMPLSNEDIIIKKVNWQNKVQNIKEIVDELNIGMNSVVFIDDSDFEVNLVKESLPEVDVVQVPSKIYDYPFVIRRIREMFYNDALTQEDLKRVEMYKVEQSRKQSEERFDNLEDYINSLKIETKVYIDETDIVERCAQMTQKTNQFNLTTKRYTLNDMNKFLNSEHISVFALDVKDKFGSYGITGLAIVEFINEVAVIDTLLMSCRILGRGIEQSFFEEIRNFVRDKGATVIKANYIKTLKNAQVEEFYDKMGMNLILSNEQEKKYEAGIV